MHLYLIAGEPSGDLLGARLMQALKRQNPAVVFSGIGGPHMEAEGLHSRLPISELSLMGFVEVLPHIPRLLRRIHETVEDVIAQKPEAVITIDSPGFCFRVVAKLREKWQKNALKSPKFVHYVAPSVWAYKPERAKKLAALYDHVLTLLPFEPPYFEAEGMTATFVGHPLVEHKDVGDGASFRTRHGIAADAHVIAVLPGSRKGEIMRHMSVMREAIAQIASKRQNLVTILPIVPHLKNILAKQVKHWPTRLISVDQTQEKWDAFAAANIAIAKSGTVSLELALADTPMVVMYKVHPLSAWLLRRMMLTTYVSLVNILEKREVIPELLQEKATAENIAAEALALLENPKKRAAQSIGFKDALLQLGMGEAETPSEKAARCIQGLRYAEKIIR